MIKMIIFLITIFLQALYPRAAQLLLRRHLLKTPTNQQSSQHLQSNYNNYHSNWNDLEDFPSNTSAT
ncbi:hypothetical protein OnM2_c3062o106 [Erysiphe neolycopersici]|uniref:Secreted protein n=1 Tax=Erysiphe neolycopersici TaxID=212602 RepID=A0A420HXK2_9PEZI|nr:hypothetical protein OnM2_c3062o106 [Erysiphe neolycopersici]